MTCSSARSGNVAKHYKEVSARFMAYERRMSAEHEYRMEQSKESYLNTIGKGMAINIVTRLRLDCLYEQNHGTMEQGHEQSGSCMPYQTDKGTPRLVQLL